MRSILSTRIGKFVDFFLMKLSSDFRHLITFLWIADHLSYTHRKNPLTMFSKWFLPIAGWSKSTLLFSPFSNKDSPPDKLGTGLGSDPVPCPSRLPSSPGHLRLQPSPLQAGGGRPTPVGLSFPQTVIWIPARLPCVFFRCLQLALLIAKDHHFLCSRASSVPSSCSLEIFTRDSAKLFCVNFPWDLKTSVVDFSVSSLQDVIRICNSSYVFIFAMKTKIYGRYCSMNRIFLESLRFNIILLFLPYSTGM